jgi:beta-lactamase superfamily II metal-dependent hydrolase
MFRIHLLPAEFGDAIWIEYGPAADRHRILIDCGTSSVYPTLRKRILDLPEDDRRFELFVVTHVDVDHIGGAIDLLKEREQLGVSFGEIWFNGYVHLTPGGVMSGPDDEDILGPLQGEELTQLVVANGANRWNAVVKGGALVVPESGPVRAFPALPGGMKLTLLSPTQRQLDRLKPVWEAACRKAGIVPGGATAQDSSRLDEVEEAEEEEDILGEPDVGQLAGSRFKPDSARPNGTSIALLAEYAGRRVLLAADAYAPVLIDSLSRLPSNRSDPLALDGVKMSHHGSRGNTSVELVRAVKCSNWLVSTNGKQFKHPDREAIARVIRHAGGGVKLHFNYRTDFNDMWAASGLRRRHGYETRYPSNAGAGIVVDVSSRA